ncbi:TELO2-interacting protein 2 isoform X2 [Denticeps clupeoides]|uniref:TELO2-interacting protein 2 n=2 Tax=Denticeps clupeoides TaxID=299321 RepID=A0AAY4AW44_9TELE|nr:TELO2-interacting protein 2 isoform X2 [Denticeps clupeoides]XP_028851843.1 TELO2-interacting protein 2 isoform X2 [Denticeps clupeoides]
MDLRRILEGRRPVTEVLRQICGQLESATSSEHRLALMGATEQLIGGADAPWLFPSSESGVRGTYLDLAHVLARCADLPVCESDSGTLPPSSYEDVPVRAQAASAVLKALYFRLGSSDRDELTWDLAWTLAPAVCVFAVAHLQDHVWTNKASRKDAFELLALVTQAGGCRSVSELLCGSSADGRDGVFKAILDLLQPQLNKNNWKRNEATKHVFTWMLVQVQRPCLTDYLVRIFPPSLLISDDFRTENKVLGVHCLHHIILNVPAADLCQFNRAQVLYHALFNHLYTPEAPLIQVVLPCLLDLLCVLENPPTQARVLRKMNRYDEVLRLVLTHMEMEHKLDLRCVYAGSLVPFIEKMGIVIVRHLKRLERVIVSYLEISDSPEEKARLSILDALERTLQVAWPRMECRLAVFGQSLLRFLCDVSMETLSPDIKDKLLGKATHCLQLLDFCTRGKLKVLLMEVDSSCANDIVLQCIRKVTQEPPRE